MRTMKNAAWATVALAVAGVLFVGSPASARPVRAENGVARAAGVALTEPLTQPVTATYDHHRRRHHRFYRRYHRRHHRFYRRHHRRHHRYYRRHHRRHHRYYRVY